MNDPVGRLSELAAACLVLLGHPGDPDRGGSGVWVAPGQVLTCAHVVPDGPASQVKVEWDGHLLTGEVTRHVPNPGGDGLWPYPDLAIVEIRNPPPHPCAWLSDRRPAHDAKLIAFGHTATLHEGLRRHRAGGVLSGEHDFGTGSYWQIKANEFVAGMSGGPVLDLATGAVCALVTTTIGEGADRGGYAVPLIGLSALGLGERHRLLSAHDRFHHGDRRWTRIRQELPPPPMLAGLPLHPAEEAELLGHLAGLAEPNPAVLGMMRARTLRDAVYRALDEHGLDDAWILELFRLVHCLTGAEPGRDRQGLYDWATALAGRTGRRTQLESLRRTSAEPTPRPGGVISVEIVPGTSRVDRYRLTVSVSGDHLKRRVLHKHAEPTLRWPEVREQVTDRLRDALEFLEGNAMIEFVVPIELFGEPFDELSPVSRFTNLGRQYRVVLRDYDRQRHRAGWHAWQERWHRLHSPDGGIRWMNCTEETDPSDLLSDLDQHPGDGVLALTRRPQSTAETTELLRAALEAGMPAVVWRRDTCADHDRGTAGTECSGDGFRAAIDGLLRAKRIGDLPERMRGLRSRAASSRATDAEAACRGAVLIWDDPGRVTDSAPLHEPPYRAQEPS